jgi:hypothetical protein
MENTTADLARPGRHAGALTHLDPIGPPARHRIIDMAPPPEYRWHSAGEALQRDLIDEAAGQGKARYRSLSRR